MGISPSASFSPKSPLGEACLRMDLTAIHEILENIGYKDDEGVTNELSFQMWTDQMQTTINSKKKGDSAFWCKDSKTAIDCYTQFIEAGIVGSPTVFAHCSLSYLMSDSPQEALKDAMQAQIISPAWHVPSYLQASALFALKMENEAHIALKDGSALEARRRKVFDSNEMMYRYVNLLLCSLCLTSFVKIIIWHAFYSTIITKLSFFISCSQL